MAGEVFWGLDLIQPHSASVLTVGSFDGVHRGHQAILTELRRVAGELGVATTVVTFEPHPQLVLKKSGRPEIQVLTTIEEKIQLLQQYGIARVVVIPFTLAFAQTPSETFVREMLHQRLGMQAMVIGHDHGFGKNREGDVATLRALGQELGFAVYDLPPLEFEGIAVNSTRIRQALHEGALEKANAWLGHDYAFSGRVRRGAERGRTIGFPTLNLEPLHERKLIPAHGVYVVRARLPEGVFGGMMNIGVRPTFAGAERTLEVHLFEFARQAYEEICEVTVLVRLRAERKFESIASLTTQLQLDRAASQEILREGQAQPESQMLGAAALTPLA